MYSKRKIGLKKSNRRTEDRFRQEIHARVGVETSGTSPNVDSIMPCVISNISIGGVKIVILNHQPIVINTHVRVYFNTSNSDKTLELAGIVRWRNMAAGSPSQVLGVEFLVPERDTLNLWLEYASNIIENAKPEDLEEETIDDPWAGVF